MSERFGKVVVGERAVSGVATVRVSIEDASIADASSVRLAETVLHDVQIEPGAQIPFAIEADAVPRGAIVRVHVDYAGDGELAQGDQYSTISIPAEGLGDDDESAGEVPVELI